jgi:hypothetical protein
VVARVVPALLGALLVCGTVTSPAQADDLGDARAQASAAADRLAVLQVRIARAQRAYATALDSVGQRVIEGVAAETAGQDAARAAATARAEVGGSVRALYIAGGQGALVASAFAATNSHDLALRLTTAARVMSAVQQEAKVADEAADLASAAATRASADADHAIVTADRIAAKADDLQTLLDEAQAELDRLSARARGLQQAKDAAAALAAARAAVWGAPSAADVQAQLPPEAYAALYRAAARTCPGMPWTLLAAVGQVESGHGRNNGPSSAGAVGPMQFMPRTFAAYAVDGDGDGVASPWSPPDAVFTAARYLCVNGGGSPATVRQALFAYNRAQWYVDLVLAVQARIDATV